MSDDQQTSEERRVRAALWPGDDQVQRVVRAHWAPDPNGTAREPSNCSRQAFSASRSSLPLRGGRRLLNSQHSTSSGVAPSLW